MPDGPRCTTLRASLREPSEAGATIWVRTAGWASKSKSSSVLTVPNPAALSRSRPPDRSRAASWRSSTAARYSSWDQLESRAASASPAGGFDDAGGLEYGGKIGERARQPRSEVGAPRYDRRLGIASLRLTWFGPLLRRSSDRQPEGSVVHSGWRGWRCIGDSSGRRALVQHGGLRLRLGPSRALQDEVKAAGGTEALHHDPFHVKQDPASRTRKRRATVSVPIPAGRSA